MNIFEKMYVGIQSRGKSSTVDFPLGFAVPYSTKSDFKKRKETVDNWCGQRFHYSYDPVTHKQIVNDRGIYEGEYFPNEPRDGWRFEKSVSRWSTSNKLFRVADPLGFTVEISAENLADVILNTTIINGEIQGKMVLTRENSTNYLTRMDHPEYLKVLKPAFTRAPKEGDIIQSPYGKMTYLGTYYLLSYRIVIKYYNDETRAYDLDTYNYRNMSNFITNVVEERDPKPWKIFGHFNSTDGKTFYYKKRSLGKYIILSEGDMTPERPKLGTPIQIDWKQKQFLFNSKKELMNFPSKNYSIKDLK